MASFDRAAQTWHTKHVACQVTLIEGTTTVARETNYTRAARAYTREIKRAERAAKECGHDTLEGQRQLAYAQALRQCMAASIPAGVAA